MTWNYKVPQFAGSRWEAMGYESFTDAKPDEPTVGVYCDRDGHETFLIGMYLFTADAIPSQRWRFNGAYPTGAKEIIVLPGAYENNSFILNDKPLNGPVPGHVDTSAPAGRIRNKLKCRTCRYRQAFLRQNMQSPLNRLWDNGVKEISIVGLARSVGQTPA